MADTRTVARMLEQVAEWYPENTAFVQAESGRRLTYAEATDRARRLATALAAAGVGHGDRVAQLADPSIEHALAFYGVQTLGAIDATLHVRESVNVIREMVADLEPSALLFDAAYAELAGRIQEADPGIDCYVEYGDGAGGTDFATALETFIDGVEPAAPSADVTPDDPAFINFSSGTTGRPKGVVHTHEEAIEACHGGLYMFQPNDGDVLLNASTPSFIAWKILALPITNVGGTLVLVADWQPDRIADIVHEEGVTLLNLVPTQWKMVARHGLDPSKFESVRLAGYAGEAMGTELFAEIQASVSDDVTAQFGTTETMQSGLALLPHRVTEDTLQSIGRPVPNVDVRIIEPDTHDPEATVETGEVGELIVRGPAVAETVWKDPEKTREIFHPDGWWFSGDLAERRADGNVYLRGRTDNMIISGGINIYAEGVEGVIEGHPAVAECAIIGVPDETWGEAVTAYVIPAEAGVDVETLDAWCRENDDLADYQRPKAWTLVEELPRTNTGKLDRASIRAAEGIE